MRYPLTLSIFSLLILWIFQIASCQERPPGKCSPKYYRDRDSLCRFCDENACKALFEKKDTRLEDCRMFCPDSPRTLSTVTESQSSIPVKGNPIIVTQKIFIDVIRWWWVLLVAGILLIALIGLAVLSYRLFKRLHEKKKSQPSNPELDFIGTRGKNIQVPRSSIADFSISRSSIARSSIARSSIARSSIARSSIARSSARNQQIMESLDIKEIERLSVQCQLAERETNEAPVPKSNKRSKITCFNFLK